MDESCFVFPVCEIAGPIETDFGYQLVLVEERVGDIAHITTTNVVPGTFENDRHARVSDAPWRTATNAGGVGDVGRLCAR